MENYKISNLLRNLNKEIRLIKEDKINKILNNKIINLESLI